MLKLIFCSVFKKVRRSLLQNITNVHKANLQFLDPPLPQVKNAHLFHFLSYIFYDILSASCRFNISSTPNRTTVNLFWPDIFVQCSEEDRREKPAFVPCLH